MPLPTAALRAARSRLRDSAPSRRAISPRLLLVSLAAAGLLYPLADSAALSREPLASSRRELPAAAAAAAVPALSAPVPYPLYPANAARGEVRAMWVVRDSMKSPQRIRNVVAMAKKHGFNTLFVQVRGRGDAFYDSRFEPRSEELSGQPLDFDPLAMMVEEGHRAGLEVHAWMNTFLVWSKGRRPYSSGHVVNQHPEWLVRDKQNQARLTPNGMHYEGAYLDPAIPGVREYTKNVFLDVATRYAVDGIHFDYVRYPSPSYSFSPAALAEFREYLLPQVSPQAAAYADKKMEQGNRLAWYYCFPREWREFRQSRVTETVQQIAQEARALRPGLIVSAAVFPDYTEASQHKGQAWRTWLQEGILDAACPMTYNRSTAKVARQIEEAVAESGGKPIIAGVGAWQMSAASAIAKSHAFRKVGAAGVNFFSYGGMTKAGQSEAYLTRVGGALFSRQATIPDWRRYEEFAQRPPQMGSEGTGSGGGTL